MYRRRAPRSRRAPPRRRDPRRSRGGWSGRCGTGGATSARAAPPRARSSRVRVRDAARSSGVLGEQAEQSGVVEVLPVTGDRVVHLRGDGLGAGQAETVVGGGVLGESEVLAVESNTESGVEAALGHAFAVELEVAGAREAAVEGVTISVGVDAGGV